MSWMLGTKRPLEEEEQQQQDTTPRAGSIMALVNRFIMAPKGLTSKIKPPRKKARIDDDRREEARSVEEPKKTEEKKEDESNENDDRKLAPVKSKEDIEAEREKEREREERRKDYFYKGAFHNTTRRNGAKFLQLKMKPDLKYVKSYPTKALAIQACDLMEDFMNNHGYSFGKAKEMTINMMDNDGAEAREATVEKADKYSAEEGKEDLGVEPIPEAKAVTSAAVLDNSKTSSVSDEKEDGKSIIYRSVVHKCGSYYRLRIQPGKLYVKLFPSKELADRTATSMEHYMNKQGYSFDKAKKLALGSNPAIKEETDDDDDDDNTEETAVHSVIDMTSNRYRLRMKPGGLYVKSFKEKVHAVQAAKLMENLMNNNQITFENAKETTNASVGIGIDDEDGKQIDKKGENDEEKTVYRAVVYKSGNCARLRVMPGYLSVKSFRTKEIADQARKVMEDCMNNRGCTFLEAKERAIASVEKRTGQMESNGEPVKFYTSVTHKCGAFTQVRVDPGYKYVKSFKSKNQGLQVGKLMEELMNKYQYHFTKAKEIAISTLSISLVWEDLNDDDKRFFEGEMDPAAESAAKRDNVKDSGDSDIVGQDGGGEEGGPNKGSILFQSVIHKNGDMTQVRIMPGYKYVRSFRTRDQAEQAAKLMEDYMNKRGHDFLKAKAMAVSTILDLSKKTKEEDKQVEEQEVLSKEDSDVGDRDTGEDDIAEESDGNREEKTYHAGIHKSGKYTQVRVYPGDQYVKSFQSRSQAEQAAKLMEDYMNKRGHDFLKAKAMAVSTILDLSKKTKEEDKQEEEQEVLSKEDSDVGDRDTGEDDIAEESDDNREEKTYHAGIHKSGKYTQVRVYPGDQYVKSFQSRSEALQAAKVMEDYMNNQDFTFQKAKNLAISIVLGNREELADDDEELQVDEEDNEEVDDDEKATVGEEATVYQGLIHKCGSYTQVRISPGDLYVKSFKSRAQAEEAATMMEDFMNNKAFAFEEAKRETLGNILSIHEKEAAKGSSKKAGGREAKKPKGKVTSKGFKKEKRYAGVKLQATQLLKGKTASVSGKSSTVEDKFLPVIYDVKTTKCNYFQLRVNPGQKFIRNFRDKEKANRAGILAGDYMNKKGYSFGKTKQHLIQLLDDEDAALTGRKKWNAVIQDSKGARTTYYIVKINPKKLYVKRFSTKAQAEWAVKLMEEYMNDHNYSFQEAKRKTLQVMDGHDKNKISTSVCKLSNGGYGDQFQVNVNPGSHNIGKYRTKAKASQAAKLVEEYMNDSGYSLEKAKRDTLSKITEKRDDVKNAAKAAPETYEEVRALVYKVRLADHDYFQVNVLRQNVERFRTETQAYRVAHLMEEYMNKQGKDFEKAKLAALSSVEENEREDGSHKSNEYKGVLYRQRGGFQVRITPGSHYVCNYDKKRAIRAVTLMEEYMNKCGYPFQKAKEHTMAIIKEEGKAPGNTEVEPDQEEIEEDSGETIDEDDNEQKQEAVGRVQVENQRLKDGRRFVFVNPGNLYVKKFSDEAKAEEAVKLMDEYMNRRGYSFAKAKTEVLESIKKSKE